MNFKSLGQCVSYYKGVITIDIALPQQAPFCQYCQWIKSEERLKRFTCRFTDEMILDPFNTRGALCPIEIEE